MGSGTAISSIVSTIGVVNTSSLAQSSAFTAGPSNPKPNQMGSGVWVREIGGRVDSEADSLTAVTYNPISGDGTALVRSGSGTQACETQTRTDFVGTQIGFDVAKLNFANGGDFFLGLTAGHTAVKSWDRTPGLGTFDSVFDVPFAGIYAALNSGALSLDAQVRWDAYRGTIDDNVPITNELADYSNQAIYSRQVTANALTLLWNASYRYLPSGSQWFIEPSVGGIWSRASVDTFESQGSYILPSEVTAGMPSQVKFDGIDTLLGRASLRAGTTIVTSGVALQPFATASIFHEFAGKANATISGDFGRYGDASVSGDASGTSSTSRVGSYGHVGLGLAGLILDTGWLGYGRVDYRFGDNIEGLSFNIGARYHFTPAADDSLKDARSAPIHAPNWSGPYVGLYGGAMFSQTHWSETAIASDLTPSIMVGGGEIGPRASGAIAGGQFGYNWQIGHMVVGAEADWGASNAEGSNSCPGLAQLNDGGTLAIDRSAFFDCKVRLEQLALLTARIGHTWDRALFYLKGGLAIGEVDARSRFHPLAIPGEINREIGESQFQVGWTLGGGIEFSLNDRWSIKGEYMHFDLGDEKFSVGSGTTSNGRGLIADTTTSGDTVKIGVNYRFGGSRHHEYEHPPLK